MVRKGIIERRNEAAKPRGKPFPKGHKKGSHDIKEELASGLATSNEGGIVVPSPQLLNLEAIEEPKSVLYELPRLISETIEHNLKEPMNNTQEVKEEEKEDTKKDLELIEKLDFVNGENKLSIIFSKKPNRMYRIQLMLNDEHEVRPVTYSGTSTGMAFWNLLKGVLKK